MTKDKAKELFSAYYEGTLEPGLKLALEQEFESDIALKRQYVDFEATIAGLSTLPAERIEIPFDLGERIQASLDRHVWEQKQKATPAWSVWVRTLSFGAVAGVAVLGAIYSLTRHTAGSTGAGIVSGGNDALQIVSGDKGLSLQFSPSTKRTITVRSEPDGRVVTQFDASGFVNRPLENRQATPAILSIEASGEAQPVVVVIPGTEHSSTRQGSGTIEQFAMALAGFYNQPVELRTSRLDAKVTWDIREGDARLAAEKALADQDFGIDVRGSGLLSIQSN